MEKVRGASGFGDAFYLKGALDVCYPKEKRNEVKVLTRYPELFQGYQTDEYSNGVEVDRDFTYVHRKYKPNTNQFEDMLIQSGFFTEETVKGITYNLNYEYVERSIVHTKCPVLVTIPPYPGFGNGKGYNALMTPSKAVYDVLLAEYSKEYKVITIDRQLPLNELFYIFESAGKVFCQQGWGTALAEGLNIALDVLFCKDAISCPDRFINSITPEKILTKNSSKALLV